jgi:hypothetical protein
VFVVRGTKKFLARMAMPATEEPGDSTSVLGDWYATVLFWKPQVALYVDESTLLPVLMPLAPAADVNDRFPDTLAGILRAHGVRQSFADAELAQMQDWRLARTANRSVVGVMTDFARLANLVRDDSGAEDLVALSLWLARTPCGPLERRHGSPDRELHQLVAQHPAA